jgi:hypothetical protein
MGRKRMIISFIFILFVSGTLLSGCASNSVNLVDNSTLNVVSVPSGFANVSRVYITHEERRIVIRGIVKSRVVSDLYSGLVDIDIESQEGDVFRHISAKLRTGRRKKMQTYGAPFETSPTTILPIGSTVRIAFHKSC